MKEDARIEAQKILKKADIDGRDLANQYKKDVEADLKTKRQEIFDLQTQLTQRETNIDNRDVALIKKETALEDRANYLSRQIEENERKEKVLVEKTESIIKELETVANLTQSQAKVEIMARVESTMDKEIALYMKSREEEAEEKANQKAKQILSLAMSRHAQEITVEKTTSSISLPNDEMKGRIIGREGRNIKSLEGVLGVDILIDDTPETIVVSCFDPIRREIAKRTIEELISDGRIQPGRIEEIAEKVRNEICFKHKNNNENNMQYPNIFCFKLCLNIFL
jgi:ribonuclease Y